jgi:hypothetical protein
LLDPSLRQIYTDQLMPPQGYRFDRAVATTYSLDLLSLLMAPISMTLHDYRIKEAVINDPAAVIEALHRSADRFLIFCQKGRISIPSYDTLLYSYLEKVVIEVQIPNGEGVFHPKTWLLRYVGDEKEAPVIYRFMCLSRNLTFDRSWDTVLMLEGFLDDNRIRGIGLNRPLGQFISSLPDCATKKVSETLKDTVLKMAEEVTRVRFGPPEDFDNIKGFIPIGIPGNKRFSMLKDFKKSLVVSPFLTAETLKRLTDNGKENVVISRSDTLDALPLRAFESIKKNTTFYVLNDAAERPEGFTEDHADLTDLKDFEDLSGLHAKLIITENGLRATVYTGSANATHPAFSGKNIEFMVVLSGQRRHIGIKRFLGDENLKTSFMNLLVQYERSPNPPVENETRKKLEEILEQVRADLLDIKILATIEAEKNEGTYSLTISNPGKGLSLPSEVSGKCYPITISESRAKDVRELIEGGKTIFSDITGKTLTGFLAFRLIAKKSGVKVGLSFVLNLTVENMPDDRDKHILYQIFSDQETFIRYLLLILDSDDSSVMGVEPGKGPGRGRPGKGYLFPLFEEMVRAFSREPEKIDRISSIIEDLKKAGNIANVLPPGFEEIWKAFRRERLKEL